MRRSGMPMHCGISWLTDLTSGHGATWTSVSRRKPWQLWGRCVRAVAAIDLSVSHRAGAASAGDAAAALQSYERFLAVDPSAELSTEAKEQIAHLRAQALDVDAQRCAAEGRYGQAIASWDAAFKLDAAPIFLYRRAEAGSAGRSGRDALSSLRTIPGRRTPECAACRSPARATSYERVCTKSRRSGCFEEHRFEPAIAAWAEAEQLRPDPSTASIAPRRSASQGRGKQRAHPICVS